MNSPTDRPTVLQWLRYAFGGSQSKREWVLRDTTGRAWVVRHLLRATVQFGPILILAAFLPGPKVIIAAMVAGGAVIGYTYSIAYIIESNEHRLVKAGYPSGTGEAVRQARALADQQASARRHRERARY